MVCLWLPLAVYQILCNQCSSHSLYILALRVKEKAWSIKQHTKWKGLKVLLISIWKSWNSRDDGARHTLLYSPLHCSNLLCSTLRYDVLLSHLISRSWAPAMSTHSCQVHLDVPRTTPNVSRNSRLHVEVRFIWIVKKTRLCFGCASGFYTELYNVSYYAVWY